MSENAQRNTWIAIQRGQLARMDFVTEYAMGCGLTPIEAARVAVECERWFLEGVVMSVDRIAVECAIVMGRKAA